MRKNLAVIFIVGVLLCAFANAYPQASGQNPCGPPPNGPRPSGPPPSGPPPNGARCSPPSGGQRPAPPSSTTAATTG